MALDCLACGVIDEEHRNVLWIVQRLHFGNGSIDLCLCHIVVGVAIVTNESVLHHTEETMGAEELRQVVTRCQTALLVEMQQTGNTALLILNSHRVLTQHLKEDRIELGVLAQNMIVEEELVVHMGLCPDVVGEEV